MVSWAHRSPQPNGMSIGAAIFAGLTSVTDRQFDRPRYSVGNNRPHARTYVVLRCSLTTLSTNHSHQTLLAAITAAYTN